MLQRWVNWSDDHGDVETVFARGDLLTHATIWWAGGGIATSIRTYANNARYPWTPSHDRWPVVSDRADWYHHTNVTAHEHGGHFIPWEIPTAWIDDLRRTFRDRR
jgi:hypothetical protein